MNHVSIQARVIRVKVEGLLFLHCFLLLNTLGPLRHSLFFISSFPTFTHLPYSKLMCESNTLETFLCTHTRMRSSCHKYSEPGKRCSAATTLHHVLVRLPCNECYIRQYLAYRLGKQHLFVTSDRLQLARLELIEQVKSSPHVCGLAPISSRVPSPSIALDMRLLMIEQQSLLRSSFYRNSAADKAVIASLTTGHRHADSGEAKTLYAPATNTNSQMPNISTECLKVTPCAQMAKPERVSDPMSDFRISTKRRLLPRTEAAARIMNMTVRWNALVYRSKQKLLHRGNEKLPLA